MKRPKRELDLMHYLNDRLQVILSTAGLIKGSFNADSSVRFNSERIEKEVKLAAKAMRAGHKP